MQARLKRYKLFLEEQYVSSLLWNEDYSIERLLDTITIAARNGQYKKILFTGMGCSAIVSDVFKAFFVAAGIPIYVEVINDYDIDYLLCTEDLKHSNTLVIISSYSGGSQEPINAYYRIKKYTNHIVFLTSGGKVARVANDENMSLIYWKLRQPDREYPLFHVPQYLGILLDICYKLGLITSNYIAELEKTSKLLSTFPQIKIEEARIIAERLRDHDIIFIASPKWYLSLLKLTDMHFNEISMVPAHRNYLHEFTHSEVAVLSDPVSPQAVIIFEDSDEDEYTQEKIKNLKRLLTSSVPQDDTVELVQIQLNGKDFFEKFFSTLLFIQHIALYLGEYYDVPSRELISQAAGNSWYNQETIQKEKNR